jgi:beta-fructofuranosidase
MGMPREVSADDSGRLHVRPSREFLETAFRTTGETVELSPKLRLEGTGKTATHFFPMEQSDYRLEFNISFQDAVSFGVMFRTDTDMKGHRLRFTSLTPEFMDMSLLTCPPPLDDFWADQYNLHLPRDVDGPQITRHPMIDARAKITVVVRHDVLEAFAGGKSISYRLPRAVKSTGDEGKQALNGNSNGETNVVHDSASTGSDLKEIGVFVDDGVVLLSDIVLQTAITLL